MRALERAERRRVQLVALDLRRAALVALDDAGRRRCVPDGIVVA